MFDIEKAKTDLTAMVRVGNRYTVIDKEDLEHIGKFHWWLNQYHNSFYAVRSTIVKGRTVIIPMHREIMHCPQKQIVHHLNRYGLDNRKMNLVCMSIEQHDNEHKFEVHRGNHDCSGCKKRAKQVK